MEYNEYREKVITNWFKSLWKRPNSLELKFIKIIKEKNLPYKYVGDGSFLIGFKNPDFININGEKICIEVANHFHHPEPWAEKRIQHFEKWGWKCYIIFEDELDRFNFDKLR